MEHQGTISTPSLNFQIVPCPLHPPPLLLVVGDRLSQVSSFDPVALSSKAELHIFFFFIFFFTTHVQVFGEVIGSLAPEEWTTNRTSQQSAGNVFGVF